jgi:hypothetical protein
MGAKKKDENDGRDIGDTLRDLQIDQDADPAEAAREAADAVASSTDVEEVDEDEVDDEAEDVGGDDEAPPAVTAEATVVIPPPPKAAEEEADAIPQPFVPPPKPPKPQKRPAAGKGMPKGLSEKAPGAAKVKVYKRDKGQRWFIADYSMDDLKGFSDFESFLTVFVEPEYGPGEYNLVGIDAGNRELELGTIRLRGKPSKKAESGAMDLVTQMMERNERQNQAYIEQMRELMKPPPQPTNPLEMLAGVMAVGEKLNEKAEAKAQEAKAEVDDAMAAVSESGDRTMQVMMAMMQSQAAAAQQQQQMLMTILSKPKEEDPVMKLLLMKLLEDKEDSGGGAAPPPPPSQKKESTAELITALGAFMAASAGKSSGDDDFKDLLKAMLIKQESNGLGMKDVIELLTRKEEKPNLKNTIDDLAAVMNVANNLNRSQEGGPAAGLFDALAALFSNRDFAGSIANTIRAKMGQGEAITRTQLDAERQRLALQQRMTQRTMQMAAGQQPVAQVGPPQPAMVTPPPGAPRPVPPQAHPGGAPYAVQPQPGMQPGMQPHYAPPGPPNPGMPPGGPTPAQVQEAADRTVARMGRLPQLPSLTSDHINELANAADDGELVGKTVAMLIYFAEFEDWRPFSEQLLGFVRDGNKRATHEYLTAFFDGLAQIHLIEPTLAKKVTRSLIEHFDVVQAQMTDLPLEGDEEVTGDDLLDTGDPDESTGAPDDSPSNDGDPGGDGEAS